MNPLQDSAFTCKLWFPGLFGSPSDDKTYRSAPGENVGALVRGKIVTLDAPEVPPEGYTELTQFRLIQVKALSLMASYDVDRHTKILATVSPQVLCMWSSFAGINHRSSYFLPTKPQILILKVSVLLMAVHCESPQTQVPLLKDPNTEVYGPSMLGLTFTSFQHSCPKP